VLIRAVRDADAVLRGQLSSIVLGDDRHAAVGLFDSSGAALAVSRPPWMPSLAATVLHLLEAFGGSLQPGDIAVTNDPYGGGTHVNDLTIVRPEASGAGYLAARFHMADIGGEHLGGVWPAATDVWQEGARLVPMRLQRAGRQDRDVRTLLDLNSRLPDLLHGDLAAAAGALDHLDAAIADGGVPADEFLATARAAVAERLAGLRPGSWTTAARVRHCCSGLDAGFELRLTVSDGRLRFDFPDEPDGVEAFVNSPEGTTRSALLAPLAVSLDDLACNAALLEAVDIMTRPGSLFHARRPLPTAYAPYITAGRLAHAAAELLHRAGLDDEEFAHWFALPARVFALPACGDRNCPFARFDVDTHHTRYASEARK
jgi:N-methylhydantoinase B